MFNISNDITVSFFGHRDAFLNCEEQDRLEKVIADLIDNYDYVDFNVGRNGEFDIWSASTVKKVKREYRDDNVTLYLWLAYATLEYRENKEEFERYFDEVLVYTHSPNKWVYKNRNREMIDRSDMVIVYVDRKYGGAYEAYKYALKKNKKVINIYTDIDL